jgi:hypothetical protein
VLDLAPPVPAIKIGFDAALEVLGLADIQHVAVLVHEVVDARCPGQAVGEVAFLRLDPPVRCERGRFPDASHPGRAQKPYEL